MKSKKIITSLLLLSLFSGLLLTSCSSGKKGDKIEKMLEKEYGGNFYLVDTIPQYDQIWPDIDFPVPSYYMYVFEWDEVEGNFIDTVYVSTKGHKYQTNANYVKYYNELDEFFSDELSKSFPGEVVATYFSIHGFASLETDIEELSFDDILENWEFNLDCIVAVDDVEDHKAVEKALDKIFRKYNIRVDAEVISIDDVDEAVSHVDTTEEDRLQLFMNYQNAMPTREHYIYISDTDVISGATGWYEIKAR